MIRRITDQSPTQEAIFREFSELAVLQKEQEKLCEVAAYVKVGGRVKSVMQVLSEGGQVEPIADIHDHPCICTDDANPCCSIHCKYGPEVRHGYEDDGEID